MSDIVHRLRDWHGSGDCEGGRDDFTFMGLMYEAANEIERLRGSRNDTERLDALEKARTEVEIRFVRDACAVVACVPFPTVKYQPTLRAAIDAYLDAEQKGGGG